MKCGHVLFVNRRPRKVFGFQEQVLEDMGQACYRGGAIATRHWQQDMGQACYRNGAIATRHSQQDMGQACYRSGAIATRHWQQDMGQACYRSGAIATIPWQQDINRTLLTKHLQLILYVQSAYIYSDKLSKCSRNVCTLCLIQTTKLSYFPSFCL